jgi:hypothetical protein
MTAAVKVRVFEPDEAARRSVLGNYRRNRKYDSPVEAIRNEVDGFARVLAADAVETGEVDEYYARRFAAATAYYDLIWAKWNAKERPNFWRDGKLAGATS